MGVPSSKIHVTSISKLPEGFHWVILEDSSVNVPGDERSRTNPGHGYPAHSVNYMVYTAYSNAVEWRRDILKREKNDNHYRTKYRAFKVYPAEIKVSVSVDVDIKEPSQ